MQAPLHAADDAVTLNFQNAEIDAVVKAVAEITGRNFVLDPRVKGTVNIISTSPMARSLVYPTLLSALRMQGYAAVEANGVVKIVPETDAKTHAMPAGNGNTVHKVGAGDRIVTQVYSLKYESAAQLVGILRPLISANNTISAYPANNSLIITDYADNLKRLERVIMTLDQPTTGEPEIIPVKHASAFDLAQTLNRLMAEGAAGTGAAAPESVQRVTIVADGRTNSLLVRADNTTRLQRVRALVARLDAPGGMLGNIRIVYLKNAEAVRVAQTLRLALGGDAAGGGAGTAVTSPLATAAAAPGAAAAAGQSAATAPLSSGGPGGPVAFSVAGATIQADPASNALIITAPEPIYNNLRAVIDKLDVRRAQVYVEALIADVSAEKAAEFGIQWQALDDLVAKPNTRAIGGTNFGTPGTGRNIIDAARNLSSVGQGLNIGVVRGQVTLPGIGTISNLGLLARALEADANANILSTPTLLTLDNEEARIVIGQNVPFITGQYAQSGGTTTPTPFQTIERKDVGLVLRVKPQITEGGIVRLAIYQEVSSVQERPGSSATAGPVTNKRSIESNVLVDDGEIIALGGLIQDSLSDGSDRVPVLGSIPVVGNLFRYDSRKRTKTNLMVFLRPYIVRNAQAAQGFTQDRYDYIIGEQQRVKPESRPFLPDMDGPRLPSTTRRERPADSAARP